MDVVQTLNGGHHLSRSDKGWKDSNWYVNATNFWREYRKHRIGLVGLGIMFIFFGMAIFAPYIATHNPNPVVRLAPTFLAPSWLSVFDPAGVVTGEYLEDPSLEQAPIFNVTGSDEFAGYHQPIDELHNQSYVNLTWTHTAGTELDFRGDTRDDPWPDYNDYVYFEQQFEWPYNNRPNAINLSITFGTFLEGDFDPETSPYTAPNLMFRIYVWVVDSSDNWILVYESREGTYLEDVREKRLSAITTGTVYDIFDGMISTNTSIPQEDPDDIVKFRVGLAPTYRFQNYSNPANPYLNYTGSVTFKFTDLKFYCSGDYWGVLGTTNYGGDAWSQIIYGSRISLMIGLIATGLSTGVGVIVGMVAGYFGGKVDEVLMRVVDFLLVIPGLPLMMVLASFLGASIGNIIIVIAILGWTGTSRLIRSQVLAEKNKAYVESARAIGASDTYIMFRHILPNVTPILFANITLGVVGAILSEAGLSFLGLTSPEDPSWGRMLADARTGQAFIYGAWWVVLFPGLMITLLSLSFTFVGHTLDQVLNPRLRER
jgi:ABC-type dipeptide/oligopeptide/nickel transport system permease subunit